MDINAANMVLSKVLLIVADDEYFLSHRQSLAHYLDNQGCEVVVACTDTGKLNHITCQGFKAIDLKYDRTHYLADAKLFFTLRRVIKQEKPDVIHNVALRVVFVSLLSLKTVWTKRKMGTVNAIMGLGHLFTHQCAKIKFIRLGVVRSLRWLLKDQSARVIVQNSDDYTILTSQMVDKDKVALIKGSGVTLEHYTQRQHFQAQQGCWHVSMLSRLVETKGVYEFFQAAKLLNDQGYNDIMFHLYGEPHPANPLSIDADKVRQWQQQVTNFYWHGHVEDVSDVYSNSHVAVLTSYREGMPKALIEAAACGLPIITTDTPGCREICQHRVNGLLAAPKSAQSLVEAILYFVDNPEQFETMGGAGRQLVEQEFTAQIVNEQTWQVYQSIMQADFFVQLCDE